MKAGEQATLVGRTGAGKSTVFKLLLGLYRPEKGHGHHRRRGRFPNYGSPAPPCIGCVEQHFLPVPGTVLDQITLGDPRITRDMAGRPRGCRADGPSAPLTAMTRAARMALQGEWQPFSIARAAAADPAVLLLDEITANRRADGGARARGAAPRVRRTNGDFPSPTASVGPLGGGRSEIRALDGETGEGEDLNPA